VSIDNGSLKGIYSPDYPKLASFRGIPYAAPPVGQLRWTPPHPPARWHGIRKAIELSSACPQSDRMFRIRQRIVTTLGGDLSMVRPADKTSEDCLYLNVMTRLLDHNERRPVMVFIHVGGGVMGRGDDDGACGRRSRHHQLPSRCAGVALSSCADGRVPASLLWQLMDCWTKSQLYPEPLREFKNLWQTGSNWVPAMVCSMRTCSLKPAESSSRVAASAKLAGLAEGLSIGIGSTCRRTAGMVCCRFLCTTG
jgi:hypothetical protein